MKQDLKRNVFVISGILVVGILLSIFMSVQYFFYAAYMILQYVVLASAWNLLSGYVGYVNFGVAAFFAVGAYTSSMFLLHTNVGLFIAVVAGGLLSALLGIGIGFLTLRLRGVFFSIATLALSVVILMIIVNTDWLGGARGLHLIRPRNIGFFSSYTAFMFLMMLILATISVVVVFILEKSWIGRSFIAIKDSEIASACSGTPVLRLKVFAAGLSGLFMGLAGGLYPHYIIYLEPYSTMSLDITVNSLAMALVGGTGSWFGPLIGAVIIGTMHQIVTVVFSSELNLMLVGIILIGFVILAPKGIVGLMKRITLKGKNK